MKIDKNSKRLQDLWTKCVGEQTDASQETKQQEAKSHLNDHTVKCQVSSGTNLKIYIVSFCSVIRRRKGLKDLRHDIF